MSLGKRSSALVALVIQLTLARHVFAVTQTAVPISGAQDVIVDDGHHQVYVTTSSGSVQRYDLTTHSLLTPWSVGVNLGSIDLDQ